MTSNSSIVNAFKVWIFPGLVTALATSIWYDVSQIKSDVKTLMIQSGIDKTRIDELNRRVTNLESAVYNVPKAQQTNLIGVLPSKYFLKEEELDVNKYLKRRI